MLNLLSKLKSPIGNYLATSVDMVAPASIHCLLAANSPAPLLIVTTSSRTSQELTAEICSLIGSENVVNFPAWETLPHERLSPKADTVTLRFKALNQIVSNDIKIITCSIRALLQPIIANNLELSQIKISANQQLVMFDLIRQLSQFGFTRSDLVERRGDFAVRGGILDLFPADQEHPIRIDFFGDEIEEISYFAVADQRSLTKITGEIIIYPCRELLLDEKVKENAKKLGKTFPEISEMTEKIIQGITFEGMESLAAGLVDEFKTIIDYLPKQTQIWFIDKPRLRSRAADLITTNEEFLAASWSNITWSENEKLSPPLDLTAQLGVGGFNELVRIEQIANKAGLEIRNLNLYPSTPEQEEITFIDVMNSYGKKYENALSDIKSWQKSGYQVIFTAAANGTLKRFSELLNSSDLANEIIEVDKESSQTDLIYLYRSDITHGFISENHKLVLITDKDISGQRSTDKDLARMPSRRKKAIDPMQLKSGDYVVHEQHGVGRYVELINRNINNISIN